MKNIAFTGLVFIIVAFLFPGCSSDDSGGGSLSGTELSISDIQGSWNATSFVFDRNCPPGQDCPVERIDLIAEGATATMVIQANGRFTITSSLPGGEQDVLSGQMSFDEDLLIIAFDDSPGEEDFFGIQLTNNKNDLYIHSNEVEYDFDEDGTDDPASVGIVFVRTS